MIRQLSIKVILLSVILVFHSICFSQNYQDIVKEAKTLPLISIRATVSDYLFDKLLYINKDSLNRGFTIVLQDTSYKVFSFLLVYDCEYCDIWEKMIYGNMVSTKDAPILKSLKKNEMLNFSFFKLEKAGKFYTIPEFNIIVTD